MEQLYNLCGSSLPLTKNKTVANANDVAGLSFSDISDEAFFFVNPFAINTPRYCKS